MLTINYIGHTTIPSAGLSSSKQTLDSSQHSSALSSCFQTLLRLGDLHRWQNEGLLPEDTADYGPSVGFYDLASKLNPDSGATYHQLAVIETLTPKPDLLRVLYYLYRSVTCKIPHSKAHENLKQQLRKTMSHSRSHTTHSSLAIQQEDANAPDHRLSELVTWLAEVHVQCSVEISFDDYLMLEGKFSKLLRHNLAQSMHMSSILKKIVLVNISAEWIARQQYEGKITAFAAQSRS